ncbi:MAG: response regulator [Deltaproteobacteria bacterium]|nr:response regulator [Deltaproteobacteria bacterium]
MAYAVGSTKDAKMAQKKEPIEIHCLDCNTGFRLWVPLENIREWEAGVRVNCIRCGAQHFVRRTAGGSFEALPLRQPKPADEKTSQPRPKPARETAEAEASARDTRPPFREAVPLEEAPETETILLIEDDKLAREMVQNTLKDVGIRLVQAKNAAEALKALRTERVNLIVTDLYLKNPADPESLIDGEDLLKRVVASGMSIPAIITTGKDILDDLVLDPKWFDLHVKGFIQKGNPFWAEELKLKIKEVMYKD